MPTPRNGYFKKDKTKVPSVTTILSRFKESGALMYWAWDQGRQGLDFRDTSQKAMDSGTIAHKMVECDLRGVPYLAEQWYEEEVVEDARKAFSAYKTWKKQTRLKVISLEAPLVSEEFSYGGTPDGLIEIDGQTAIMDLKTSNAIYRDYLLQIAAYKQLWEENTPERRIEGGYHLLRFSKEGGDFSHNHYPELEDAWAMFVHLRVAYDLDLLLKKRAG